MDIKKLELDERSEKLLNFYIEYTREHNLTDYHYIAATKLPLLAKIKCKYCSGCRKNLRERGLIKTKRISSRNHFWVDFEGIEKAIIDADKIIGTIYNEKIPINFLSKDLTLNSCTFLINLLKFYFDKNEDNNGYVCVNKKFFNKDILTGTAKEAQKELTEKGFIKFIKSDKNMPEQYKINFEQIKKTIKKNKHAYAIDFEKYKQKT